MSTAYKYGFGPLGAAYTGYRYAKPYLYYGSAIAAGLGAAKLRSWFGNRRGRNNQRLIGLAGYRPPEKKECTVADAGLAVVRPSTTTASIINVIRVGQGSDKTQRIGNKISLFSTQLNATFRNNASVPVKTRVMLVYDREWNQFSNTTASFSIWLHALLDVPSFAENYVNTTRNSDYMSRFRVIKDWTISLQPASEPGSERDIKFYTKLNKMYTKFATTGSDAFSVSQGQLCYVFFADRASDTTNVIQNYSIKTKYIDN